MKHEEVGFIKRVDNGKPPACTYNSIVHPEPFTICFIQFVTSFLFFQCLSLTNTSSWLSLRFANRFRSGSDKTSANGLKHDIFKSFFFFHKAAKKFQHFRRYSGRALLQFEVREFLSRRTCQCFRHNHLPMGKQ